MSTIPNYRIRPNFALNLPDGYRVNDPKRFFKLKTRNDELRYEMLASMRALMLEHFQAARNWASILAAMPVGTKPHSLRGP